MNKRKQKLARRRRRRQICRRGIALAVLFAAVIIGMKMGAKFLTPDTISADTDDLCSQLEEKGYPESLLDLLDRNPETKQFVLDYKEKKDIHADIDLTGEVTKGEIPLFLQWDERWGYEMYGDDFLAVTGCGPTCLSMVVCGLSGETSWNPYAVACMAEDMGYYVDGVGSSWDIMTGGAEELGLTVETVSFDADSIVAALQSGTPIICSMGPGDFTSSGHFIVLCGVDEDGSIRVNDPNSRSNSEKSWDVETLMSQIRNLWGYSY